MATTVLAVAVPAAVIGAMSMGLASASQARATKQVDVTGALNPRLFVALLRRPLWLVGIGGTVLGLALQLVALSFGPLVLVQPVLITALLFASVFSAWMSHVRVDGVILLGGAACCGGLAAFLLLARPTGGKEQPASFATMVPLGALLLVLVAVAVVVAMRVAHHGRVLLLAVATGLAYGMTAALMKVITGELRAGPGVLFTHPSLYITCVLGPAGFLLSQNTFQQGRLVSPAVAVITTVDPLVGVLLGLSWFDERVAGSFAVVAGELVAGVAVVGGIALLAMRGEHLVRDGSADALV